MSDFFTVEQMQRQIAILTAENERMREVLTYAVKEYGRHGGPWNVPTDPGGWITKARDALQARDK